jgi:hypothetical protein
MQVTGLDQEHLAAYKNLWIQSELQFLSFTDVEVVLEMVQLFVALALVFQ